MSFKKYIILMAVTTMLAFFSFILVITRIDPNNTNIIGICLFYISLVFSLVGFLSLFMIAFRWIFVKNLAFFTNILRSFRQAVLFSVTICSFLMLKSIELLRWWNVVLIIAVMIGIEFFFVSHRVRR